MQDRPRTKIVVTLGPATSSEEIIAELIEAGMNIARLNFSHSGPEEHLETANKVRRVSERLGEHIAILGDLPGPKMRTGETEDPNGVLISAESKPILTYDHDGKTT